MRTRTIRSLQLFLLAASLLLSRDAVGGANSPSWWSTRGVVSVSTQSTDYSPLHLGQLKWMATNACVELDANLPGGAGDDVESLVEGFASTNNYCLANVGQLKFIAAPFYDRLIAEGYAVTYPWTPGTVSDDADLAIANIGQLKNVFGFDLTFDADDDGIPDWWEDYYFSDLPPQTGESDYDHDGLVNTSEYAYGTSPVDPDSDDDGLCDGLDGFLSIVDYPEGMDADDDGFVDGEQDWGTDSLLADSDGDVLPDGWEVTYGLNPTNAADASADPDDDGLTNLQEYQRGFDPTEVDGGAITLYVNAATGDDANFGINATGNDVYSPVQTIDRALDLALDDDTIRIEAGTYPEIPFTYDFGNRTIAIQFNGNVIIE